MGILTTITKQMYLRVSESEQKWIHQISKKKNTTVISLVIHFFEVLSKELDIPLPEDRLIRRSYYGNESGRIGGVSGRAKFMAKIDKELGINE